jgi:hypothetical protein
VKYCALKLTNWKLENSVTAQGVPAWGGVAASITVAELETMGVLITPALILGEPAPGVSALGHFKKADVAYFSQAPKVKTRWT